MKRADRVRIEIVDNKSGKTLFTLHRPDSYDPNEVATYILTDEYGMEYNVTTYNVYER